MELRKNKYYKWVVNYVKGIAVWTFFLYISMAAIFYTQKEILETSGVQPSPLQSIALVLLMVGASFVLTRKVLEGPVEAR
jgi:hypothetical protein